MAGAHQLVARTGKYTVLPVQLCAHVWTAIQVAMGLALIPDKKSGGRRAGMYDVPLMGQPAFLQAV